MRRAQKIILTLYALLFFALCAVGYLAYERYWVSTPADTNAQVVESTLEAVARHIVLPEDEEPTVATVTTLEPLAGQPFFKNAKVGDRVIIYTQAQKAILYDPVADRLVEVAPLAIDQSQTAP